MPKTEMLGNEPQAKVVDYGQLSNYQKRKITTIASKNIGIDRIAKLLKPLKFCTPQTTLKVVEESKVLSDDDFKQLKTKMFELITYETVQTEHEQTTNEPTAATSEQAEEPAQPEPEQKKYMSEQETKKVIKMYLDGKSNADIAEVLGRTENQIARRISYARHSEKYGYLFGNEKPKGEEKMQQKTNDKCYVARGEGHIFIDAIKDEISVNDDCVLRKIAEYLDNQGLNDFYGKIEIRITVMNKPVGMQISEE